MEGLCLWRALDDLLQLGWVRRMEERKRGQEAAYSRPTILML